MKRTHKFPLMLLAAAAFMLAASRHKPASAAHRAGPVVDTNCLVKNESSFDFPDSLRKKVNQLIEDRLAGGIEEKGVITWENSPDAPEYYQIVLRKNKVTIKYKGTVCVDKLVAENIDACKEELKKLLNK